MLAKARQCRSGFHPNLEVLEDRIAPAVLRWNRQLDQPIWHSAQSWFPQQLPATGDDLVFYTDFAENASHESINDYAALHVNSIRFGHSTDEGSMFVSGNGFFLMTNIFDLSATGTNTIRTGGISLTGNGDHYLFVNNPAVTLKLHTPISGTGRLIKDGAGLVELKPDLGINADNAYSGATNVDLGTLHVLSDTGLGNASAGGETFLRRGAVLWIGSDELGGIHSVEPLVMGYAGSTSLEAVLLSNANVNNTWEGSIGLNANSVFQVDDGGRLTLNGGMSGTGLIKRGRGTLRILGNENIITGNQVVQQGTLQVDGTITGGTVVLTTDAGMSRTLEGNGAVAGIQANDGKVAPTGSLTATSTVTLSNLADFFVHVTPAAGASSNDRLVESSTTASVNLGDSILGVGAVYVGRFVPVGTTYTIISKAGTAPFTGIFHNRPEGSTVTAVAAGPYGLQYQNYRISYHGGDGNDVTLTFLGATGGSGGAGLLMVGGAGPGGASSTGGPTGSGGTKHREGTGAELLPKSTSPTRVERMLRAMVNATPRQSSVWRLAHQWVTDVVFRSSLIQTARL